MSQDKTKLITLNEIEYILSKCDVILPYKNCDKSKKNIRADLASHITIKGVDCTLRVIHDLYGIDEEAYYQSWLNSIEKCGFNLFITRREKFEKYAEWIFSILFELEKTHNIAN